MIDDDLLRSVDGFAVTGRKLKNMLKAPSLAEPEAVEYAYRYLRETCPDAEAIVSAGGETFMAYGLDRSGRIINVHTGNKCASGTGEFFLQQIKRMDLSVQEAVVVADLDQPYIVAGRCSVFCKSDCTHALNKGASKGRVVAGLCRMMAVKITELLKKTRPRKVLLVGGASANTAMLSYLRQEIKELYIPAYATCFEALGAALWARERPVRPAGGCGDLFARGASSFSFLPPLKDFLPRVTFKEAARGAARAGDNCIVGLDVGSTTTKAVVLRTSDNAVLAGCYLRTSGDPVQAARNCYRELTNQLPEQINISGLGVTGSGRQIAGLHALTPAVINEIIAHAAAAVYYDPRVDTIFEIGGQDAKYTYLTNGVAADYAMNEACSAGTGSFLEEAAGESLDILTEDIGEVALGSARPPNFSDQCAAFICSDIKSAIQEGIEIEDLAAGLVYSIGLNYINRVKGNRAVGRKVFMQGGVCYNRAVPAAMAALTGKEIIVPPEPGLMGAFGVALEVKSKLALGLLPVMEFDLAELAAREVARGEPFTCAGGKERCDRKCLINIIQIKGKKYPFGGACNKYVNLIQDRQLLNTEQYDLVKLREKLVFDKYGRDWGARLLPPSNKTVAVNDALMTNTLFPLYYNFFQALGFEVISGGAVDRESVERRGAEFCFPVEIAHGTLGSLCKKSPDVYFLPHVKSMIVPGGIEASVTCPLVQAEPYYLKTTFDELKDKVVLSPVLNFSGGYEKERDTFVAIGRQLGIRARSAGRAFDLAVQAQRAFHNECRQRGEEFLAGLEANPGETAVVLFGRPYNAFTGKANMGIPQKFATRGYRIIPHDFLPYGGEEPDEGMYWAQGQMILKAAKLVQRHPQLFAAYITNFSCGPDSFLVGYFRDLMGQKPSLTLELDSHTADAGLDTRIEAFLDVVKSHMEINRHSRPVAAGAFTPAKIITENNKTLVVSSRGEKYPLTDPRVHVLVPSMGDPGSRLLAATLRHVGVKASPAPSPTSLELKLGKGYASCKECLPLILTVGSLMSYLETRVDKDEILIYFMPKTSGPCRFGQYNVLMKNLIAKMRCENVTMISLTSDNSYAGFGTNFSLRAWQSVIIADVLEEIYSAVLTMARDREKALEVYNLVCKKIVYSVERDDWEGLRRVLQQSASALMTIEKVRELEQVPKVALTGEIYVRRDGFSRQYLVERLAREGIMVKTAPVAEWLYYCDYLVKYKYVVHANLRDRLRVYGLQYFKKHYEKAIKEIMARSGFYHIHLLDVERMIDSVADLISPRLTGEAILTAAAAFTELVEDVAGVISLGPFGCMPGRIAESIVNGRLNEKKIKVARDKDLVARVMERYPSLPFLAMETDGNAFPQSIEARLEIFCLQVKRLHDLISEVKAVLQLRNTLT
jgi:predicted CoA-substrate-specific enzyme activase